MNFHVEYFYHKRKVSLLMGKPNGLIERIRKNQMILIFSFAEK